MPEVVIAQRMWQRRGTLAEWTAANPVLEAGEIGVELSVTDPPKFKIGDGATAYLALAYQGNAAGRNTVTAVTSVSGVVTLDWSLGDYFTLTLSENVTSWVIANAPGSGLGFTITVEITQAAGSYTVVKPGTTPGGTMAVSTANGAKDLLFITSFNNGGTLRSNISKAYS